MNVHLLMSSYNRDPIKTENRASNLRSCDRRAKSDFLLDFLVKEVDGPDGLVGVRNVEAAVTANTDLGDLLIVLGGELDLLKVGDDAI